MIINNIHPTKSPIRFGRFEWVDLGDAWGCLGCQKDSLNRPIVGTGCFHGPAGELIRAWPNGMGASTTTKSLPGSPLKQGDLPKPQGVPIKAPI